MKDVWPLIILDRQAFFSTNQSGCHSDEVMIMTFGSDLIEIYAQKWV